MTSETRLIYAIETLLTAVVGIAWISVLQLICPRWPLMDTWALAGQATVTVMTFLWSTGNGTHVAYFPAFGASLFILFTYMYAFGLSLFPNVVASASALPPCSVRDPAAHHVATLFGETQWHIPLSAVTIAILLVQTTLAAACSTPVTGGISTVAWVDMWNVAAACVHGLAATRSGCGPADWGVAVMLWLLSLALMGTWLVSPRLSSEYRPITHVVGGLVSLTLGVFGALLSLRYNTVNAAWALGFLALPMVFDVLRGVRWLLTAGPSSPPAAYAPLPTAPELPSDHQTERPPPTRSADWNQSATVPNPAAEYVVPVHTLPSQSGYHMPPSASDGALRSIFGGEGVRQALSSGAKKRS